MQRKIVGILLLIFMMAGLGCSSNQTIKNVWKGTKSFWYSTVNVPASIDYDEDGSLDEYEELLARSMVGIDKELIALEKVMNNADKPPTRQWMASLFGRFPWLSGFTGIKADATMIGQEPGPPIKALDFYPLLEEDPKQNRRALRGYVQDTAMGPEVLLAMPLYDAQTFLGVVSVYFDMRALLRYSETPDDLVIISPNAILWPGKYNFSSTPMAGIAWDTILLESNSGTVSNATGTFYWSIRYLGNVPLIFAVPVKGSFGNNTPSRTGPTSDGPFVEPKALKMPPAPEIVPPPPPPPAPVQRRVVRRRVPMPMPMMPPIVPQEKIEPVRMPSPLHPAPVKKPEVEGAEDEKTTTPTTPEVAPTETKSETPAEETSTATPEEQTKAEPESAPESTPENSSGTVTRPSPFGPK